MEIVFRIVDTFGMEVYLSRERYRHMLKHPQMHNQLDSIKETLTHPTAVRHYEEGKSVKYYYKEFKNRTPSERYLLVSVKYLNGVGFIITSFFTNKITGKK